MIARLVNRADSYSWGTDGVVRFEQGDTEVLAVPAQHVLSIEWIVKSPEPVRTPRAFFLVRDEDPTGISGTGVVAEGCAFTGDIAVVRWVTEWPTSSVLHERGMASVYHLHGHGGKTRIVWADTGEEYQPPEPGPEDTGPIIPQITRVPAEVIKSARLMGAGLHTDGNGAPGTSVHLADVEVDGRSLATDPTLVESVKALMDKYGPRGVSHALDRLSEAARRDETVQTEPITGEPVDGA